MLGAGVVGYLMRKYDFQPAPLVVGLVLGTVMERSLRQTLIISKGDIGGLWESSISAILLLLALLMAIAPGLLSYFRAKLKIRAEKSRS
jgi:putative tricarboxylic transport membrane protein